MGFGDKLRRPDVRYPDLDRTQALLPQSLPVFAHPITCRCHGAMLHVTRSVNDPQSTSTKVSQAASKLLALCNMKTLYLRNVPEDVVRRLQLLAERDGTSVGALAVRELSDVSRRADNAALMAKLPDLGVEVPPIVEGLDQERNAT